MSEEQMQRFAEVVGSAHDRIIRVRAGPAENIDGIVAVECWWQTAVRPGFAISTTSFSTELVGDEAVWPKLAQMAVDGFLEVEAERLVA